MNPFTQQVIQIIKSIPPGYVMSYGQIAAAAGNPRSARQVARILHSMSRKYELPWHRVINAQGGISTDDNGEYSQREMLALEGIVFNLKGKVDFTVYRWVPEEF